MTVIVRVLFSILYFLGSTFCFFILAHEFNTLALFGAIGCLGLIGWNVKKMISNSNEDETEANEEW